MWLMPFLHIQMSGNTLPKVEQFPCNQLMVVVSILWWHKTILHQSIDIFDKDLLSQPPLHGCIPHLQQNTFLVMQRALSMCLVEIYLGSHQEM